MSQKVWVIDDKSWGGSPGKTRIDNQPPANRPGDNRLFPKAPHKSPALSFTLSMLVWGSGHLYIREYRLGSIFMLSMFLFYSVILSSAFFPDFVSTLILRSDLPASTLIVGTVVFFLGGVFFWMLNAVHAYYRTEGGRCEPFQGVRNELWPLLGSLLCPGWGQFLNGQPRKGLFFLPFGLMGIYSLFVLFAAQWVWPFLKTGSDRFVLDLCLAAALSVFPTSFLMWIVSVHDSFRSCSEPVRKRPVLKRWQFFSDKVRAHGMARVLVPQIRSTARSTAILGLLLAVLVLAGIRYFPKGYYLDSLEKIRLEMLNKNLEITPELIRLATDSIDR